MNKYCLSLKERNDEVYKDASKYVKWGGKWGLLCGAHKLVVKAHKQ